MPLNDNYPTIEEALKRVEAQKEKYERNLVGKSLLYIYIDLNNSIAGKEVIFKRHNFLHLTGLDYKNVQSKKRTNKEGALIRTGALEFYDRLGRDNSLISDMSFIVGSSQYETDNYYYFTQHKLDNLSKLTSIANKAQYIGKYRGNQDFDIIINKYDCSVAFVAEDDKYVPISSLFGKPEQLATDIRPVLAIFSKEKGQKEFKMQYLNSKVKLSTNRLFSKNTLDLLDISSFDNPKVKFNEAQRSALIHAFKATTRKYIQSDIKNIDSLKSHAFDSYDEMMEFSKACFLFEKSLDSKLKVNIATELLNERKEHVKDPEEYILIGSLGLSIEKAEKALNNDDSGNSGGQGVSRTPQMVTGAQKTQQKSSFERQHKEARPFKRGVCIEVENQYKEKKETHQSEPELNEEVIFEEPKSGRGR